MSTITKKMITTLMITSMLFTLIPVNLGLYPVKRAQAASAMSGSCGENATWSLVATKETDDEGNPFYALTISGTGKMSDFSPTTIPWKDYDTHIKTLVINNGITHIGNDSFYDHIALDSVSLPDSLISFGSFAFANCRSLSSINLPSNFEILGDYSLNGCSLETISLPQSLKAIGKSSLANNQLKDIFIPKNVSEIGEMPFSWYSDIQSITVDDGNPYYIAIDSILYRLKDGQPDSLVTHGRDAYSENETLIIPSSVTTIETGALRASKFKKVVMPENLVNVGQGIMSYSDVEEVVLNDKLEYLGSSSFEICRSLKKITIGKNLRTVGGSFNICLSLSEVIIDKDNPYIVLEDNVLYNSDKTSLQLYLCTKPDKVYYMPDTVTNIESEAINHNNYVERIILSKNLKTFKTIGNAYQKNSFSNEIICYNKNLKAIYFTGDAPSTFTSSVIIHNNDKLIIYYPENAKGYNSASWSSYTLVAIDPNLAGESAEGTIGDNITWNYNGTTGVLLLEGEGSTGDYDGAGLAPWNNAENVVIYEIETEGITELGDYIFSKSPRLMRVTADNAIETIGKEAFSECPKLLYAEVYNAKHIGSSVFKNDSDLNDGVYFRRLQTAGDHAFSNCTALTSITLGGSIGTISEGMFENCSSLVMTMIPESVTAIEADAYKGCSALHSINIPVSVESIGSHAFAGTSNMRYIYFYGGIPDIADDCFASSCNALTLCYRAGNTDWASQGTYYMNLPLKALSKFYTERKDHYSFDNSHASFGYTRDYKIPLNRYLTLLNRTKSLYYDSINTVWKGSCFGMTGSTLEFYENSDNFKLSDYDKNAKTLYDIPAPKNSNSPLTKLIELYQISQFIKSVAGYKGQTAHNLNDYSGLIRKIEEFERSGGLSADSAAEPVIMLLFSPFGGHAVIPVSVDPETNGSFSVHAYDPNYPDSLQTIKINPDLKSISYGFFFEASYLSYEVLRDAVADPNNTKNASDDSLYLSVNKSSGTINTNDGKPMSQIDGAYEQSLFNGDDSGQDSESDSYRSYVVPAGDYLLGKSEALNNESTGTDDSSESDTEPVTFVAASDDMFASVEVSDPDAILEVNDSDTGDDSVGLTIRTENEDTEADIKIANSDGTMRELHAEGGSVEIIMSDSTDLTINQVDASDITVTMGGKTLSLDNGSTDIALHTGQDENPYQIHDFSTEITCNGYDRLQGSISVDMSNNSDSAKASNLIVTYSDTSGAVISQYTTSLSLESGINTLTYDFDDLEADFGNHSGETAIYSTIVVSDDSGHEVSYNAPEQIVDIPVRPSPSPTISPTETPIPTSTPTIIPSSTPDVTATPTATPTANPTTTPAETSEPVATSTVTPTDTPSPTATSTPSTPENVTNRISINTGTFWDHFLQVITFGYYEPEVTVTIDSSLGDNTTIYYYIDNSGSTIPLTDAELTGIKEWNSYEGEFRLDNPYNVVYAKIIDEENGIMYYICSDGITYVNPTAPPTATPTANPTTTPAETSEPVATSTVTPNDTPMPAVTEDPASTDSPAATEQPYTTETPTSSPSASEPPTVTNTIMLGNGSSWTRLLKVLTYSIYPTDISATITSSLGDRADIFYYIDTSGNNKPMSENELDNIRSWKRYNGSFTLNGSFNLIYARIIDNSNDNVYYVCSDGINCIQATATPRATDTPDANSTQTPVVTNTPDTKPTQVPQVTDKPDANSTEAPIVTATPYANSTETPTVTATPYANSTETPTVTATPYMPSPSTQPYITVPDVTATTATPSVATTAPKAGKKSATGKNSYSSLTLDAINKGTGKTIYKVGNIKYTIISKKKKTACVYGAVKKNAVNIVIPGQVKIKGSKYKVIKIRSKAFKEMKRLQSVVIGKNIQHIGSKAFIGCTKIKKVENKSKYIKNITL